MGKEGLVPLLSNLSKPDAKKAVKEVEDAIGWFRRTGQFMDVSKAKEEREKYSKAKNLAQWWADYDDEVDQDRAERAADDLENLLEWNRNTKKKKKAEDPENLEKMESVCQI